VRHLRSAAVDDQVQQQQKPESRGDGQ
jgi:hypothetical protein